MRNALINLRAAVEGHGIADLRLDSRGRKLQLYLRCHIGRGRERGGVPDRLRLAHELSPVFLESAGDTGEWRFLKSDVAAPRRQAHRQLVPGEIHAGYLPEQAPGGLEDDRVCDGDDAAGGSARLLRRELKEVHADQTEIDHFAGDVADLDTVADPQPIFADEDEIAHQ